MYVCDHCCLHLDVSFNLERQYLDGWCNSQMKSTLDSKSKFHIHSWPGSLCCVWERLCSHSVSLHSGEWTELGSLWLEIKKKRVTCNDLVSQPEEPVLF